MLPDVAPVSRLFAEITSTGNQAGRSVCKQTQEWKQHIQRLACENRRGRIVTPQQRDPAGEDLDALLCLIGFGRLAVVNDSSRWRDGRACTKLARPAAQVRFFTVHEKLRIKAVKLLPQCTVYEKKAARDNIDCANAVTPPTAISFGVENRAAALQLGQTSGKTEDAP